MAGGVRQDTKKDKIRVLRQEPGSTTKKEIIVDLSAIEKKRAEDIALMPNDIVEVQTSEGKALLAQPGRRRRFKRRAVANPSHSLEEFRIADCGLRI